MNTITWGIFNCKSKYVSSQKDCVIRNLNFKGEGGGKWLKIYINPITACAYLVALDINWSVWWRVHVLLILSNVMALIATIINYYILKQYFFYSIYN